MSQITLELVNQTEIDLLLSFVKKSKIRVVSVKQDALSKKLDSSQVTIQESIFDTPSTEKRLLLSDFSFAESRQILKNFKGSLSDAVIEERRAEL